MAGVSITNNVCKGVRNRNDGTVMTWWKTSFNMPVPYLFGGTWSQGGPLDFYGSGTSFDLSGFQQGWEVVANFSLFHFIGPYAGGNVNVYQRWKKPDGTVMFTNSSTVYIPSMADSSYLYEYMIGSNQGHASWEISVSGTYTCEVWCDGGISGSNNVGITFSNVPSITTYNQGYMWVEGANLRWTSANGHIHTVYGSSQGYVGTSYAGSHWIEGNYVMWVGNDGNKYRGKYNFQQFASTWSNGSPGPVNPGTGSTGFIWLDNQYGFEHMGYIAGDGYKWVFPSGGNPYANPPASQDP